MLLLVVALALVAAALAPTAKAFHGLGRVPSVGASVQQRQPGGGGFFPPPRPLMPTTPLRAIRGIETFGGDFTLAPEVGVERDYYGCRGRCE